MLAAASILLVTRVLAVAAHEGVHALVALALGHKPEGETYEQLYHASKHSDDRMCCCSFDECDALGRCGGRCGLCAYNSKSFARSCCAW